VDQQPALDRQRTKRYSQINDQKGFMMMAPQSLSAVLLALVLPCTLALPVAAAQVGTAIVRGKVVVLDDNGTWKYKDDKGGAEQTCDVVDTLEFCVEGTNWRRQTNKTDNFVEAYETKDGRYYVGIVAEPFGKSQGYTYDALRQGIIANMASAVKVDDSEIPILATSDSVREYPQFHSVTYSGNMNKTPILFHNLFKIGEKQSHQIAFWTIGTEMTPDFQAKVDEFLKAAKLK
jgi:hypothetical protein